MKRIVSFVLAAGMALSMAACSSSGSSTAQESSSTASSATSATEESSGGEILIGCLQDITGSTSSLGISVQAGAQAAVDEINANGGINGKTLVMNTYDTKGDVTEAVNAYITAVTVDEVSLIVGPPVANIANAIKETSEGYDVPVVGLAMDPSCQLKEDGTPYKNMFCLQPSADSQGEIMAAFALKNGYKTFGVLYNQENSYSVSLLDPFLDRLAEDGVTVDDSMIVAFGAADTDYKTLLQPLVSANVDAIYCPNYTQQLVAIVTAATELGYEGKIIAGLDAAPAFNTTYGGDCSNVYYINNINTEDPEIAAKIAEIEDTVSAPNKYFLGYDIVMAAADAISKNGTDYEALHSAFENLSYEGITGTITIDPATHMPTGMSMFMYTYDNQTPVMLEQFAG
ncbi:MAG: ABC transporter substrate-binding protein [Gemmiger sp.]|uniref:ABC transporter substrate-binding protein n=1 Tax=Gemmiger sp. TaxID=2049027 RepID=UPI002E75E3CC|nr:ABC transporter substrate-binding protein [Gemmiger sp.]MEE0709409.1 ABC transporter substrate-binding protein [Gemmiger sp.]